MAGTAAARYPLDFPPTAPARKSGMSGRAHTPPGEGDSAQRCESIDHDAYGPFRRPGRQLGTILPLPYPTLPYLTLALPRLFPEFAIIFAPLFVAIHSQAPSVFLRMPTPSAESSSSRRNPDLDSSSVPTATATASHPPASKPDPTENADNAKGRLSSSAASGAAELASLQVRLRAALRQFPDFPTPGVLFEDILPIFHNPGLHDSLLRALDIHIDQAYGDTQKPDVIVGLEARGFLFGPSLALRLGAAFVPVRKKGKLPGPLETAGYQKEYGQDFFQIQQDAIKPGQRVLIVDDIIATGEMMTPKLPPHLSNTMARRS